MRQNSTAQRPIEPPRLPMATCHSEHQGYTFAFPRTVVWVPRSCPSALRRNSILAVQNGFNPPFRLDCLTQATSLLPSAVTAKRHAPAGLAGRPFAPHGGHQDPWELISNFSGIPGIHPACGTVIGRRRTKRSGVSAGIDMSFLPVA